MNTRFSIIVFSATVFLHGASVGSGEEQLSNYLVLESENLVDWQRSEAIVLERSGTLITVRCPLLADQIFYRLVETEMVDEYPDYGFEYLE